MGKIESCNNMCAHTGGAACLVNRAEPYLQHDTRSKWDVLTFFAATFAISRSSHIDIGRQDEGAALEEGGGGGGSVLIPVRGDVHN